jgi:pimeloyl-ACP methyl ester carboxylesterase
VVEKPIIIGHSFGGVAAAYICSSLDKKSAEFRERWGTSGVVLLDPWMEPFTQQIESKAFQPIAVPVLCTHAEYFQWESNLVLETAFISAGPLYYQLKLKHTGHMNYADGSMYAPIVTKLLRSTGVHDPVDLLLEINRLIVGFVSLTEASRDRDSTCTQQTSLLDSLERSPHVFQVVNVKA